MTPCSSRVTNDSASIDLIKDLKERNTNQMVIMRRQHGHLVWQEKMLERARHILDPHSPGGMCEVWLADLEKGEE